MKLTKTNVRRDFQYARLMMRQAEAALRSDSRDFDDLESIANELLASVSTFAEYIEQRREATLA